MNIVKNLLFVPLRIIGITAIIPVAIFSFLMSFPFSVLILVLIAGSLSFILCGNAEYIPRIIWGDEDNHKCYDCDDWILTYNRFFDPAKKIFLGPLFGFASNKTKEKKKQPSRSEFS